MPPPQFVETSGTVEIEGHRRIVVYSTDAANNPILRAAARQRYRSRFLATQSPPGICIHLITANCHRIRGRGNRRSTPLLGVWRRFLISSSLGPTDLLTLIFSVGSNLTVSPASVLNEAVRAWIIEFGWSGSPGPTGRGRRALGPFIKPVKMRPSRAIWMRMANPPSPMKMESTAARLNVRSLLRLAVKPNHSRAMGWPIA